jgi:hypothetical protein
MTKHAYDHALRVLEPFTDRQLWDVRDLLAGARTHFSHNSWNSSSPRNIVKARVRVTYLGNEPFSMRLFDYMLVTRKEHTWGPSLVMLARLVGMPLLEFEATVATRKDMRQIIEELIWLVAAVITSRWVIVE